MKIVKKILKGLLILIALCIILLFVTGNSYVFKGITSTYLKGHTTANINDADDFEFRLLTTSNPNPLEKSSLPELKISEKLQQEFDTYGTAAFLVLQNDEIVLEYYNEKYGQDKLTNSFSMAKTIVAFLLAKAVEDGYINSLDDPITKYLENYKGDPLAEKCTVRDLVRMTSGYDWTENYYFPINPTAKAYYTTELKDHMLSRGFVEQPGTKFKYLSGNTQLLGFVIEHATGKNLSDYLSEKLWDPMGMEYNAKWSLDDKDGVEKAYCCIHSVARDFAKFGLLLMHDGLYNNQQIIPSDYIQLMKTHSEFSPHYGYSVWIDDNYSTPFYFMRGHLGQYVICIPAYDLVIVRLGESKDRSPHEYSDGFFERDIYIYIEEVIKAIKAQYHVEKLAA